MESYIDWNEKKQSESFNGTSQASVPQIPNSYWHDHTNGPNNVQPSLAPVDVEHEHKGVVDPTERQQALNYDSQNFRPPYTNGLSMSPSSTPPLSNPAQYMYSQSMPQQQQTMAPQNYPGRIAMGGVSQASATAHQLSQHPPQPPQRQQGHLHQYQQVQPQQHAHHHPQPQQAYGQQPGQVFPDPYSYANNSNMYNMYAQSGQVTNGYMGSYGSAPVQNGPSNPYNTYSLGQGMQQLPRSGSPQVQAQFPYRPSPSPSPMYVQQATYQYQRPEDALKRVHQQGWTPQPQYQYQSNVSSNSGKGTSIPQWQAPAVAQTVYFPMEGRAAKPAVPIPTTETPAAQAEQAAPQKVAKVQAPSSPPRPSDPLGALRFDVSQCLTDYNTSRDLKGCSAALLAIMATCDPATLPSPVAAATPIKTEDGVLAKGPASASKEGPEPKIKQITLLAVVNLEIKGAMVEEVSKNKSIRAKLRTWFVRAHKDSSYVVLKAIISVLDKLTFLSARLLAEVKFGKALVIVYRKCEDVEVKKALESWVSKAEDSLVVEKELESASSKVTVVEDEPKKKKTKLSGASNSAQSNSEKTSPPPRAQSSITQKGDEKSKLLSSAPRKNEPVAKTNTAFFKKDSTPAAKPVIAKPGMAAALAGIKARKKSEAEEGLKNQSALNTTAKSLTTTTLPKALPPSKAGFSALKLVESLKRTASPAATQDAEPNTKRRKQKKSVTWRPDAELEQIKIFESLEPEDGEGDVAHTPHEYGNARDLDRKEGALMHGGILPDREEDFLDWSEPKLIDFSHRDLRTGFGARGPKRSGDMKITSKVSELEDIREKTVPEVMYTGQAEVPWTPLESLAISDHNQKSSTLPRIIPLPAELRNDWRVIQVLGELTSAKSPAAVVVPPKPAADPPVAASAAGPTSTPGSGAPDIAAILAGILASQQKTSSDSRAEEFGTPARVDVTAQAPEVGRHESGVTPPRIGLASGFDPKLAEILAQMAAKSEATMSASFPGPPPDTAKDGPPGLKDVRPWVKLNDGGKYREPCRFINQGRCEKGDACPYIHPQS